MKALKKRKFDFSQGSTLRRLLRYLGKQKILLLLSLLCALISALSSLYLPILTGRAVDCVAGAGRVDFTALSAVLLQMALTLGAGALFQLLMNLVNNRLAYCVVRDLRRDCQEKVQRLPLSYLDGRRPGEILNRVISDAEQTANGLLMGLTQLFSGIVTILGTIALMLYMNAAMALAVIVLTPLSLLVAWFIASKTYHLFLGQSQLQAEQTALCNEMLTNRKEVSANDYEQRACARFDTGNEALARCSLQATFYSSLTNPSTRFINALVYAAVGISGAFCVIGDMITVGQLVSFLSYANQYTKPFNEISGVIAEMQNALACAARIFELLSLPEEHEPGCPTVPARVCAGNIAFEDVSFSYTKEKPLIEHFNFCAHAGEKIAIVGPTGCGKTTMINLLMRFYDVDSGRITLDGTDISTMTREALHAQFGMVLQETWLMGGTVLDNIRFGSPHATKEQVIAAAQAARAHGFIMRLPEGYQTQIGDGGIALSEGQKQLICIARVMLRDPTVLILDEATSSIDTRTEQYIQQAFDRLCAGKTSFVVAHRLATVRNADQIIVMRDGHIVEVGTHAQLLEAHGFYEQLYQSQFAHTANF